MHLCATLCGMTEPKPANVRRGREVTAKAREARTRAKHERWAAEMRKARWFCARTEEFPSEGTTGQLYATNGMSETYRVTGWTEDGLPLLRGREGSEFPGIQEYLFTMGPA